MANIVLNRWDIKDKNNYDDSWMKDIIKLISNE